MSLDQGNVFRWVPLRIVKTIAIMLTLAVLLMSGRGALAEETGAGITTSGEYNAVQFLWQVLWERPWTVDEEMTASESGEYDRLVLHSADATIRVIFDFDQDLVAALETMIQVTGISEGGVTILGVDSGIDGLGWPYLSATLAYPGLDPDPTGEPLIEYLEVGPALTNDMNAGVHLTSLIAPESEFLAAYASAQNHVVSNLGQAGMFFTGNPAGDSTVTSGTGGATDDALTAEDYVSWLGGELGVLTGSIDDLEAVLQSPTLGDETSVNTIDAILKTWIGAYETARTIVPPSGYEQVHALYLDFTALLSGAASDLYAGNMNAATQKLDGALTKLTQLQSTLAQGSGDLLAKKSG